DYLSWRWIFFVNVPVGALVLLVTTSIVPESRVEGEKRHYDALGAVLVSSGLALLVYAISEAPNVGWGTARTILLLIAAGARRVSRHRAARLGPAEAGPHLPGAHGCRRDRGRLLTRGGDFRELLPADAVRAGRPALLAAEGRLDVPRHGGNGCARGRRRAGPDDEVRREADHRHRPRAADHRHGVVLADTGRREVRVGSA